MEEVCAIEGGASGGGGGGDRKLRPHHHRQQQALKCPRCDSFNTKFCYYNNYNQSQPRHFCKSCRRYWTKGGVLRNVPVGGGNRKPSKLSKSKAGTAKARKSHSHSHPSSESSDPAAATMAAAVLTSATNEVASAVDFGYIIPDSRAHNVNPQASTNPSFDSQPPPANHSTESQIFTEIGFTSLENMLGFSTVANSTSFDPKLERAPFVENHSTEIMNQTVHQLNFAEETAMSDGGLAAALDWGSGDGGVLGGRCGDEGLFDVTGALDQAYWCDQSLNYLI